MSDLTVNSTSTTTSTSKSSSSSAAAGTSASTLDYDAFLKLLIAQMKNQDPTNPMDSSEYIAQLATFSQVEQTMKTNTKLDSLLTSSAISQAEGLVGRTVSSDDGKVSGQVKSIKITDDGPLATLSTGDKLLITSGVTVA